MSRASGRFSRFPAVNRDVAGYGATYDERRTGKPVASSTTVDLAVDMSTTSPRFDVDVETMTVAEVLDWVGDDIDRREWALASELTGRNRKGLIKSLSE